MDEVAELKTVHVVPVPTNIARREMILDIEEEISKIPGAFHGDTDKCPLEHSFADGVYVRQITIPKGMLIVGKIHKHSHPNFIVSGEVSVLTEEGPKRLKGPCFMISPAATKRLVYTHEDTVWITVHATKETELEKIEEEIIAKNYNEIPNIEEMNNFIDVVSETKGIL